MADSGRNVTHPTMPVKNRHHGPKRGKMREMQIWRLQAVKGDFP
jgi:hypothetical protein